MERLRVCHERSNIPTQPFVYAGMEDEREPTESPNFRHYLPKVESVARRTDALAWPKLNQTEFYM